MFREPKGEISDLELLARGTRGPIAALLGLVREVREPVGQESSELGVGDMEYGGRLMI